MVANLKMIVQHKCIQAAAWSNGPLATKNGGFATGLLYRFPRHCMVIFISGDAKKIPAKLPGFFIRSY
jgi:hypothetical protein